MYNGKIFCSLQCDRHEDIMMCFQVLTLLDEKQMEDMEDYVAFYEYMDKAGPRSINGLPMFMSARFLTSWELKQVRKYFIKVEEAMKKI